ncbi:MAG: PLDc_N domain-containing protein, partial [Actinobacteria bacterium]
FRRDDLEPRTRTAWIVALLLFPPICALIYFRCGPGEECSPFLKLREAFAR